MLQAIRDKAGSFGVKILFGLLIVIFGIWGIGDIFRSRGPDTTVATVGGRDISLEQVNSAVQREVERLRGLFGGSIDAAQAKQLGVVDQALQRIISGDLVDLEIDHMGLAVGDEAVRDAIVGNSAFHNQAGAFDRNIYVQILAANRSTEAQFEATTRGDLLRDELLRALTDGMTPPKELVDALYRARAERRTADTVTLPASAAGAPPSPSEDDIAEYYKGHQDSFRTTERRSIEVATLQLDDIAADIDVSEDQLKQEYQSRQDEFHKPEQRQLQQLLLPDEAAAQEAERQLAAGKDIAAVAKDVAKSDDPGAIDLGWVTHEDLPPELADAAFALAQGGVSAPIKSTFGWHILRVAAIKPPEEQTFEQVKDKLAKDVARDHAGDRLAELANQIDDALAGGATLDDVVQKFSLKTTTAADIDSDGHGPDGKEASLPQPHDAILKAAFNTESGQTSPLTELGEDGYYIVRVEKVSPATVRPLAEVHDEAAKLWQGEAQQQALQKLADGMVQEVDGGRSLKDVAAAHKLAVTTTPALSRTGGGAKLPATLVGKLFDAKPGKAVSDAAGDSMVVAQVQSIEPADPAKDEAAAKQLGQQLDTVLQGDIVSEYDQALRRNFPVKIDQSRLDELM